MGAHLSHIRKRCCEGQNCHNFTGDRDVELRITHTPFFIWSKADLNLAQEPIIGVHNSVWKMNETKELVGTGHRYRLKVMVSGSISRRTKREISSSVSSSPSAFSIPKRFNLPNMIYVRISNSAQDDLALNYFAEGWLPISSLWTKATEQCCIFLCWFMKHPRVQLCISWVVEVNTTCIISPVPLTSCWPPWLREYLPSDEG